MSRNQKTTSPEINSASMADIAFLLLIFFMVTTTIADDKGLMLQLPPKVEQAPIRWPERNIYKILVNSADKLFVEGEVREDIAGLRGDIKKFILNRGQDEGLSDSPDKAVISIKTDRGTSYHMYIAVLDEIQAAYYEIYGTRAGITADEFRALNRNDPEQRKTYEQARKGIPMNISIAEPN
ncbi:MAG: biopolymer transporter ExbD [Bacteroidota bacterium]